MDRTARPALFCDRDGCLIVEKNFLSDPQQVELYRGVSAALKRAASSGYLLIVVTNQSGIARGLLSENDAIGVNERLRGLLAEEGVRLDAIYYCPHHPDFGETCNCRKPNRGMVDMALADFAIDLERSWVIGDKIADAQLARNVGAKPVLVLTGYGLTESKRLPADLTTIPLVEDFAAAVDYILNHEDREANRDR